MSLLRRGSRGPRPGSLASAAVLALVLTFAPACRASAAMDFDVEASVSTHYSVGGYGSNDHVHIVYLPGSLRVSTGPWSAKLLVPWIRISGGSTTIEGPTGPIVTKNGTSEGLGDVLLESTYTVWPLFDLAPFVDLNLRVKFPTADESQGLGTGEFDFSPEVELARRYGRWTPYASVGFRVLGDDSTATYRDGFLASAGITCHVKEWLEPGLFVYWRQAANKGSPDSLELLPMLRIDLGERWMLDAYGSAGFSDSSPDAGAGLEIHYQVAGLP